MMWAFLQSIYQEVRRRGKLKALTCRYFPQMPVSFLFFLVSVANIDFKMQNTQGFNKMRGDGGRN